MFLLPWHSVDATSWETRTCAYGLWQSFGTSRRQYGAVSVRGSHQNLRGEIETYLTMERKARVRWHKQMEELAQVGPTVRLAVVSDRATGAFTDHRRSRSSNVADTNGSS